MNHESSNYESLSMFSLRVLQVDTAHSKSSLMTNMPFHEIRAGIPYKGHY